MTRKDRTEGIYSRREVLDESERRQYCLIQLKDLLSYAYRYSEDVKKRFDRAQFNVEKFKTLADIKHIPILKKKELIFLQSMGPRLGGLLTKDLGELRRVFQSPGPIFDPEDGDTVDEITLPLMIAPRSKTHSTAVEIWPRAAGSL